MIRKSEKTIATSTISRKAVKATLVRIGLIDLNNYEFSTILYAIIVAGFINFESITASTSGR